MIGADSAVADIGGMTATTDAMILRRRMNRELVAGHVFMTEFVAGLGTAGAGITSETLPSTNGGGGGTGGDEFWILEPTLVAPQLEMAISRLQIRDGNSLANSQIIATLTSDASPLTVIGATPEANAELMYNVEFDGGTGWVRSEANFVTPILTGDTRIVRSMLGDRPVILASRIQADRHGADFVHQSLPLKGGGVVTVPNTEIDGLAPGTIVTLHNNRRVRQDRSGRNWVRVVAWEGTKELLLARPSESYVRTYSRSQDSNEIIYISGVPTNFIVGQLGVHGTSEEILICDLLVYYLQRFNDHFDGVMTINSGFRTPAHDRSVGGTGSGQHTFGRAADFRIEGFTALQLYNFARELGFGGRFGFTYQINHRSIHIDTRPR